MKNLNLLWIAAAACCCVSACTGEQASVPPALMKGEHAMINGTKDTSSAHRAVVALYRKKNSHPDCASNGGIFCTGTLIHPKWVLTAAHCVAELDDYGRNPSLSSCNSYMQIGIGNSLDEIDKAANRYDVVGKPKYYDGYEGYILGGNYEGYYTIKGDIALIELKTEVPSSVAKPILPHPKWLPVKRTQLKKSMEFSGYGVTETGDMGTKLKFSTDVEEYCGKFNPDDDELGCPKGEMKLNGCHPNEYYASEGSCYNNEVEKILVPNGGFYYTQYKGGPCQGDSGGPGFFTMNGVEYVSGVTSYGDKICGGFGVSTAVQDYYDWIIATAPAVADQYVEVCDNGADDNNNGKIDCDDSSCQNAKACGGSVDEICDNGIDDNVDGLTDCDDPACALDAACTGAASADGENCTNDVDDDDNGLTDCDDPACFGNSVCPGSSTPPGDSAETREICDNKKDDNNDGLVDCDDPNCFEACNRELVDAFNNLTDSCASTPQRQNSGPLGFILAMFGLLGLGAARRRMKA